MATSPIYSWPEPDNTDLVKNGALAIRTLGDAIDTTMGTMVAKTIVDAKGDLIAATAADTVARLAVGTNGQTLVADSAEATGLKWATPASGTTFVGASAYRSTTQSIANATATALTYNTESYDTDAFHDTVTNNTRMTVPAGKAGKYLITSTTYFLNNATGQRIAYIYKNGASVFGTTVVGASASVDVAVLLSYVINLAVADYVEIFAYQNSGGALNVFGASDQSSFQISYLGA